jgi:hypothetical protein
MGLLNLLFIKNCTTDLIPDEDETKFHATYAIILGLIIPFFIGSFITVSRYWTNIYGYHSTDFTIDNYTIIGFIEIFPFSYCLYSGYYDYTEIIIGLCASFC